MSNADLPQIYLASSSPRRRALLEQIGVRYRLLDAPVDESTRAGEAPEAYVRRVALAKARRGWESLSVPVRRPVLGADTAVVVDGAVLGKPVHREDGLRMLGRLSGRSHRVLSAVAVVGAHGEAVRLQDSMVQFRALTPEERVAYWATGEPVDKAGAYAIQGLGALFVRRIEGSYSGIMGLPLYETAQLLREVGLSVLQARAPAARAASMGEPDP